MSFIVSKERLEKNRTKRGGYTSAQMNIAVSILGNKKAWLKRFVGATITSYDKEAFEQGRFIFARTLGVKAGEMSTSQVSAEEEHERNIKMKAEVKRVESIQYNTQWSDEFIASSAFLQTFQWEKTRMKVLTTYGNRCMCCGARPHTSADIVLCVDHIKPRKTYPKLALELSNLQILCNHCNHGKGNVFQVDWVGDGNLIHWNKNLVDRLCHVDSNHISANTAILCLSRMGERTAEEKMKVIARKHRSILREREKDYRYNPIK